MLQTEFLNELGNDLNEGHFEKTIESLLNLLENKDDVLHNAALIQKDRLNGINSKNEILDRARVKTALEFIIDKMHKSEKWFIYGLEEDKIDNNLNLLKNQLNNLIAEDKIGQAIELLIEKVKDVNKDIYNTLILLKAQFSGNEKDNTIGILSNEEYKRNKAKIIYGFQQVVSTLDIKFKFSNENVDELTKKPFEKKQKQKSMTNKILIITATTKETKAILDTAKERLKTDSKIKLIGNEAVNILGNLGNCELYHSQCEAGATGASGSQAVITKLILKLQPTSVLMPGIAFGLQPEEQKIGDIIVSKHIREYEKARIGKNKIIPRGDKIPASPKLVALFRAIQQRWTETKLHFGTIMSGEKLVDDPKFVKYLLSIEPEAVGGEMEGVGLYTAAYRAKVDWILFKSIVDWGKGKTNELQAKSSEQVAKLLFDVLNILCEQEVETKKVEVNENLSKDENQHQNEILDLLIRKKNALEKDLILTYDSEKKFALQQQIKELERQIQEQKNKAV